LAQVSLAVREATQLYCSVSADRHCAEAPAGGWQVISHSAIELKIGIGQFAANPQPEKQSSA